MRYVVLAYFVNTNKLEDDLMEVIPVQASEESEVWDWLSTVAKDGFFYVVREMSTEVII